MDQFVARENIKRFKQQLKGCTDEQQKATLEQLLKEHEDHLSKIERRMLSKRRSVTRA